jgi:hypothetical protein
MMTPGKPNQVLAMLWHDVIAPAMVGDKARQAQAVDGLIALAKSTRCMSEFNADILDITAAITARNEAAAAAAAQRPVPAKLTAEEFNDLMMARIAAFEACPSETPQ